MAEDKVFFLQRVRIAAPIPFFWVFFSLLPQVHPIAICVQTMLWAESHLKRVWRWCERVEDLCGNSSSASKLDDVEVPPSFESGVYYHPLLICVTLSFPSPCSLDARNWKNLPWRFHCKSLPCQMSVKKCVLWIERV